LRSIEPTPESNRGKTISAFRAGGACGVLSDKAKVIAQPNPKRLFQRVELERVITCELLQSFVVLLQDSARV